jgi:azurin
MRPVDYGNQYHPVVMAMPVANQVRSGIMKKSLWMVVSLALLVSFVGCDKGQEAKKEDKPAATREKGAAAEVTEVKLSSSDQMKYDKTSITVPAGKKVKLTLTHTGKLPKTTMGHNFVLLKEGTNVQDFATKAIAAKASDYIPADQKASIIANTKLIGGGQSDTITFDAPAPGTYTYICTFPGHFAVMKGEFTVK